MRLLLAEDERELSYALTVILKHNNYSVDVVYDGQEALDFALSGNYDGMILDLMMPGLNGLDVLRGLRGAGNATPVLILSARTSVNDRIRGLDAGADDYLTKPFDTGELLARIRAITRRKPGLANNQLKVGPLTLDRTTYELSCGEQSIRLKNREFQMIELLMRNPGQLISTRQFMERIWGLDSDAEINVVWVYISYIRKKLEQLNAPVKIRASRGVGYMLLVDVDENDLEALEDSESGDTEA